MGKVILVLLWGVLSPGQAVTQTSVTTTSGAPSPIVALPDKLTNDQVSEIAKSCPLLTADEIAQNYVKGKKNMPKCAEARSIESQLQTVLSDYSTYLSAQHYPTNNSEAVLMSIHRQADKILGRLEGLACASKKKDYLYAALPLLSLVSPPAAAGIGESLTVYQHLHKVFASIKTPLNDKIAFCASSKLMQQARSLACQVSAYDEPWKQSEMFTEYRSLRETNEDIQKQIQTMMEVGKKTNTFKTLMAYESFAGTIESMTDQKPVFNEAKKALDDLEVIVKGLGCDRTKRTSMTEEINDPDIKESCKVLASMKPILNGLTSKEVDVKSIQDRKPTIEALKWGVQGLDALENPIHSLTKRPKEGASNEEWMKFYELGRLNISVIPGDTYEQIQVGLNAYAHARRSKDSTLSATMRVFSQPRDTKDVFDLVQKSFDTLPTKMDVDKKTCEVSRCFWSKGKTKLIFKNKLDQIHLNNGWKFAASQDFDSLHNAGLVLEKAYAESKSGLLKKLTKECPSLVSDDVSCPFNCNPLSGIPGSHWVDESEPATKAKPEPAKPQTNTPNRTN